MSNSPESVSGTQRVQGDFAQVLTSSNRILDQDMKMLDAVSRLGPAWDATSAGIQGLNGTVTAVNALLKAATAAAEQLSARFNHQAEQMKVEVAELQELVAKHGREADTIVDTDTDRRTA